MKLTKKLLFYVKFGSVFYFTMGPVAQGNPTGADVVAGGATIADLGGVLNVTTATDKTIINWNSFSIGNGEVANFIQPNSTSATLNRVIGDMPSDIAGMLVSNGRVGLINPNGILITKEGSINTNGFFASTLSLSDSDFLGTGKLTFKGESESVVSNSGNILARQGDVFLIGRNVQNSGTIETKDGNVALAAGSEVTLMKAGDGRLSVRIPVDSKKGSVSHSGAIKAVQQTLKNNDGNPYILGMNVDSSAEMTPEDFMNAQVAINAGSGRAEISGTITAGTQAHGGEITVEASEVETTSNARIDVSGDFGGGSIKIGGGLQGNDATMSNAKINWVQTGALLTADARVAGDGGTVIVWSDDATGFGGTISAKGGALSGNGGFAEISGKQWLGLGGLADLTAANGSTGTLLLDPTDITLNGAGVDDAPTFGSFSGVDPRTFGGGANNSSVISIGTGAGDANATLLKQLATASVIITTSSAGGGTGNITVSDVISYTSANALTLTADNSIFINDDITNNGAGSLTFTANGTGGVNIGANITAAGAGSISITSGTGGISQLVGTTVDAGSGTILVDGNDGSISLSGALTTTNNSATAVRIIDATTVSVGNITTGATGTVMLGGLAVDSITGTVGQTGIISAGTLIGNTGDSVLLDGANTLTNLGAFTTNGNFELSNSSALTLSGDLATGGAAVSLTSSGVLTLNAGINTFGFGVTLNGVGVDQTGGSIFATTATVNGGTGSIALNSLLNNFTGGVTLNATGASVSVRDTNALILNAPSISATTNLTAIAGTTLTLPAFDFVAGGSINFQSNGGSLTTTGLISASGSNSVTLVGTTGLTVAHDITTDTGNVSLTGAGFTLNPGITVDAGSGEILIDGNDGAIVLTGDLTTTNNTANAVRIIDGTTASVGNITTGTTGTVLLGGVGADILTSTVTQTGTINTGNLTVNSGSSVTLSTINADGDLQINSAGSINFTGVTDVGGSLLANTIANGGVGASITDTGAGQLLITGTTGLTAGNGSITLNDGNNNFTDVVTVTTTGAGNVILVDTNDLSLGASTIGGSLDIEVDGDIFLSGTITTGSTQTYQDDVFLSGNTILTGTTLNHTGIDGGSTHDLTLDFGTTITLPGSISNINNFTAQKGVSITGNFTTVGNQTYNGSVVTNGDRTLTGGTITFNNRLSIAGDSGVGDLNINADLVFGASSIFYVTLVSGGGDNRDRIDPSNDKNVTIVANATLTGEINNSINVGQTRKIIDGNNSNSIIGTFNNGGNADISGQVFGILINVAPDTNDLVLQRLNTTWTWDGGAGDSLWSSVNNWDGNTGKPSQGDTVIFGKGGVPLDRLSPDNDLLNEDLTPITLNVIQFTGLQPYTLVGDSAEVTGGIVNNSTVAQTINMPIILGANQTFNAATGNLTFGATVNGSFDLTLTDTDGASNLITFGAPIGGNTPLNSVLSNSTVQVAINGGSVITAGDQTYNGIVTTTGATTLNAGTGSISAINTGNNFNGDLTLIASGPSVAVRDTNELTLAAPTLGANTSISAIAGTTLTLPAFNFSTGTGSITFQSNGGTLITGGSLTTTSGPVTLLGSTGLTVAHDITTTSGAVSLTGAGVTVNGLVTVNAGDSTILVDGNDGAIVLTGALTTTNSSATAIRIIDGTTASLGNITTGATGTVMLGGAAVDNLSGAVIQTGVISAGTLVGNTGSTVTLGGDNTLTNLGTFTSDGIFFLNDLGGLTLSGDLATTNDDATISTSGLLTLAADINIGTGALTLDGVGVDQTSGKILASTGLINAGTGTIALNSLTNDFTGAVTLNATGAFVSIRDDNDLILAAPNLSSTTDITAIADGTLTLPLLFDFTAGTRDINFQSNGGTLVTTGSLTTTGDGSVTLIGSAGLTVAHNITNDTGSISLIGAGVTVNAGITVDAGSSTILVDANDGAIALNGALTTTNNTATAVRLIDATTAILGNITTGATGTIVLGEALGDNLSGAVSQTLTGILNAGTLIGNTGSTVTLMNDNTLTNLGTFTSNGNFQLNDLGGLALTGNLTTNGGLATILTTGQLVLNGNNIQTANGSVSLTGTGVTSLLASTVDAGSGTILVDGNDGALNLAGALTTTNNTATAVRIIDATSAALGNITAASGTVTLGEALGDNLSGEVTQTGIINADTLVGNTGNAVTLTNNNTLANLGTFNSIGNFQLTDLSGLALTGNLTTNGGSATILTTGQLALNGNNITTANGNVSLTGIGVSSLVASTVNAGSGSILVDANDGAIALAGALTTTNNTSIAVRIIDASTATLGNITTGLAGTIVLGEAGVDNLSGAVSQTGILNAGTLIGNTGSSVSLINDNTLTNLGTFNSSGNFHLNDLAGLALSGNLTTNGGSATIFTTGQLVLNGNSILTANGNVSLTGTGVTSLVASTVDAGSGTILVDGNDGAIDLAGALTTTNNTATAVRIIDGSTAVLGNITTGATGTVTLGEALLDNLSGAVTQTGIINAGTLIGNTGSSVTLTNNNTLTNLGTFTSTGNFQLTDLLGLALTGDLTTNGGSATILTTGQLALNGNNITTANGNVSLTGIGVSSLLASTVNAGSGTILVDANDGAINLAGALTTTNNTATAVRLIDATTASLGNITATSGTVVLGEAGGDNLSGAVTQTGIINANTLIGNTGSTVTLTNDNTLTNLGTFTSNGNFQLNDLLGLALTGDLTTNGGSATILTTGLLALNGNDITTSNGDVSLTGTGVSSLLASTVNAGSGTILVDANDGAIALAGALTTTNNTATAVRIIDSTTASLGNITTGALGTVVLGEAGGDNLSGAVTQTGIINAGTLIGNTGSSVILTNNNTLTNLGTFTSTGNFQLTDLLGLDLTGDLTTNGGSATILTTGQLALNGNNITTANGNVSLSGIGVSSLLASTVNAGSGTILVDGNDGAIALAGALTTTNNTATAVRIIDSTTASLGNITTGALGTVVLGEAGGDNLSGAVTQTGIVNAGTLIGNTGSTVTLTNNNTLTNLGTFTSNGNFQLNDLLGLALTGDLTTNGGSATILTTGLLALNGNDITTANGNVSLTGIGVTSLLASTVNAGSGTILVDANDGAIALAGALTTTNNTATAVRIIDSTTASLGNITTGALGTVVLGEAGGDDLSGAVTQTGIINAGTLIGNTGSSVILTNNNTLTNLGTFSSNGNFQLTDLLGLDLTGNLTTNGGAATILTTGQLALNGNTITTANGNVSLTGIGVTSLLASTVDAGSGTILVDANDGAINLAGALTTSNNTATAVRLIDATTASLGNITATSGTVVLGEALGDNISGAVTQTGIINANTLIGNTGNSVTLTNNNTLTNLGTFTTIGNFQLTDLLGLALTGNLTTNGGLATILTTGQLALNGNNITTANGNVSLTGIGVSSLLASTVNAGSGTILVDANDGAINLAGALITTNATSSAVRLIDASTASLGNITAISGTVVLGEAGGDNLSGAVTQTGIINANTLIGNTGDTVTLMNANTITNLGVFSSTGNFQLNDLGGLALTGNLTMDDDFTISTSGSVTNAAGVVITVQEDSSISATGSVTLNTNGTDVMTVNGNAAFSGSVITIGSAGTANFGSLTFNSAGAVVIQEDSSTEIAGVNTANTLTLTSAGAITDRDGTSITVTGLATLIAEGNNITLGDNVGDTTNFGSLTITGAAVDIQEDSGTEFTGTNEADSLKLVSVGAITNTPTAILKVTGLASFNSGSTSNVIFGNHLTDNISFGKLNIAGAQNVSIREDDGNTTLSGKNHFDGKFMVIEASGSFDFDNSATTLTSSADDARAIFIANKVGGNPGLAEFNKDPGIGTDEDVNLLSNSGENVSGDSSFDEAEKIRLESLEINYDIDFDPLNPPAKTPLIITVSNTLRSPNNVKGSFISPIHSTEGGTNNEGDGLKELIFNFAFGDEIDGQEVSLDNLHNFSAATFAVFDKGDTAVVFSSAPIIDFAIGDIAEQARAFLKRGVNPTVANVGKIGASIDRASVAKSDGLAEYAGPFWTIGYDYDLYDLNKDTVPGLPFPLYYLYTGDVLENPKNSVNLLE